VLRPGCSGKQGRLPGRPSGAARQTGADGSLTGASPASDHLRAGASKRCILSGAIRAQRATTCERALRAGASERCHPNDWCSGSVAEGRLLRVGCSAVRAVPSA
jgi:hypothetical protein